MIDASLVMGQYAYMENLRMMAAMVVDPTYHPLLSNITTPLVVEEWGLHAVGSHPDQDFDHLVDGITNGFSIGFSRKLGKCQSAKRNTMSAVENPTVVKAYLEKECRLGMVIGPLAQGTVDVQISRFGVIPKPHQPGKWQLLVDLSHPEGASVNAGISQDLSSSVYTSVDRAVEVILQTGRGTQLAKLDIESAYRMVPVHPGDRPSWVWNGRVQCTLIPCSLLV